MAAPADQLKAVTTFLGKTDGRDKLCATIQYACMFAAAGEPGNFRKAMASVAAARKVFRVGRPLEALQPVLLQPSFVVNKPLHTQVLDKLKCVLNAIYFGGDHIVWAGQAGLVTNKELLEKAQKASLWGWFGASSCTIAAEVSAILELAKVRRKGEDEATWRARQLKAQGEANKRLLVLFHACVQAALAVGLLQLRPWKPRFVGFLGVVASAINCYMLFPALAAPAKPAVKATAPGTCPAPKLDAKIA